MRKENNPLVSIRVLTFNSSRFIIETLESAKAQTYSNIELIISDDGSTDNTVDLCKDWINDNHDRFVRIELIVSKINTGVGSNMNRAIKACKGEWIKGLAGDDLLIPDAIENIINFSNKNPDVEVVFGKAYGIDSNSVIYREYIPKIGGQLNYENFIQGKISYNVTTVAYKTSIHQKVGYYEEGVIAEDIYFSRKIWKHCTIGYCDNYITMYRKHDKNISKNTWLMYLQAKDALNQLKHDPNYRVKKDRENLNFFVLLSQEYKAESLKYFLPSLRFFYDRLFLIGIFNLLGITNLIKRNKFKKQKGSTN
ncbi:MAG TPA: glycosyltransferase family 2 protein [Bacteroidales bacterium]|nr:glycosyltransferase family 2 protein [Bacteroidales bacterium]